MYFTLVKRIACDVRMGNASIGGWI